jgi:Mg2+/citrate symporter
MEFNLSAKEAAGVFAVGLAMAFVADKVTDQVQDKKAHTAAILAATAAIYTAGVVIGTNRPPAGFIEG